MARGPSGGVNPDPLTFYWRGRILHLRCDDPLNLYSTPVSILRRAMGRSEGVTSLELALRSSLGASYDVHVQDTPEGVIVNLKRHGAAPHPA
jgi:hypothetical protein